jgi:hypothetical protein
MSHLLDDRTAAQRKDVPLYRGFVQYFPDAMCAVAELSMLASKQHGHAEIHWDKNKSNDHLDCLLRHLVQADEYDTDGVLHATKVAWRAMAHLQIVLDREREDQMAARSVRGAGSSESSETQDNEDEEVEEDGQGEGESDSENSSDESHSDVECGLCNRHLMTIPSTQAEGMVVICADCDSKLSGKDDRVLLCCYQCHSVFLAPQIHAQAIAVMCNACVEKEEAERY